MLLGVDRGFAETSLGVVVAPSLRVFLELGLRALRFAGRKLPRAEVQLRIALALVKIKFAQGQMQEEVLTPLAVWTETACSNSGPIAEQS